MHLPGVRQTRASRDRHYGHLHVAHWYYLHFTDPHNTELPFAKDKADRFMPVDQFTSAVSKTPSCTCCTRASGPRSRASDMLGFDEPFTNLLYLGHGPRTQRGETMSKSKEQQHRRPVAHPTSTASTPPAPASCSWLRPTGTCSGTTRAAQPWRASSNACGGRCGRWPVPPARLMTSNFKEINRQMHATIKKVGADIGFNFNTARSRRS